MMSRTNKEKGESATHPSPRLRCPRTTSKQRSHIAQSDCHVGLELPSAKCGHRKYFMLEGQQQQQQSDVITCQFSGENDEKGARAATAEPRHVDRSQATTERTTSMRNGKEFSGWDGHTEHRSIGVLGLPVDPELTLNLHWHTLHQFRFQCTNTGKKKTCKCPINLKMCTLSKQTSAPRWQKSPKWNHKTPRTLKPTQKNRKPPPRVRHVLN